MPAPGATCASAIESAAAAWVVLLDRELTATEQDAFLQWLAQSPAHRAAFERHSQLWRDFDLLSQWRPEHSAEPNPDLLARRRPARLARWLAPVALAAAAAIALVLWSGGDARPENALLTFEAPEYRQEILPDGSIVDLNRGSHLVVHFSASERRVLLVQGEAQFTVSKDPQRPFVVRAAGIDVRAVGTAFNLRYVGVGLDVLVTEGTVRLERQLAVADPVGVDTALVGAPSLLTELSAGQRTVVSAVLSPKAPVIEAAPAALVEQLLEWKPVLLDFDSEPLSEVVAVFNQRSPVRLEIVDNAVADLPIVASIRSDNVEGFVRLLEATVHLRSERAADGRILLRSAR
ncbi:MAG TPA: FecR domain-containing protein [Opitutaceae bacterium]